MELARRAESSVLRPRNQRRVRRSILRRFMRSATEANTTRSASRRRSCASGRNVMRAIGNFSAGQFVFLCRETSLSFGAQNFRRYAVGFVTSRPASPPKCSATIASFVSSAALSLTRIKSRSRKNYCSIPWLDRAFAKKIFASFSMKRRTRNRRNFSFCSKRHDRPLPTGNWMETQTDPPRPGHFCMVGDFQQSIYRERADLPYYRAVHDALVADEDGESLDVFRHVPARSEAARFRKRNFSRNSE